MQGDPASLIYQGLLSRGLPAPVAQGFLMNFQDESGLRTDINEIAPLVPGSRGGYGLAQWTGPRRRALEAFAAQRGLPVSDLNVQLDFLMSELQGPESAAAQQIMAATTPGQAAATIVSEFLRPAAEHEARRIAEYTGSQQGQPPMGLLSPTMSTMNAPQQQQGPQGLLAPLWDRLQGVPVLGRLADEETRLRLANAMAGLSLRPNQALIEGNQSRLDQIAETERINMTVHWLQSIGRTDLAEAVAAGSLMGDQAAAIAMQPPQTQEPTALMQNYEFLIAQGMTPQDALAALNAGTVVNVGDQGPQTGPIPAGAALVPDSSSPSGFRIEPIPGGPLDAEMQAAEAAAIAADTQEALAAEGTAQTANVVIEDINRLSQLIESAPWYNPAVGTGSGLLEGVRGSNAADAKALATTIRANIGFDRLQQMREASPTGGALGAVTQNELDSLQAVLGSLDTAQSQEQFLRNLDRLNQIYGGILNKLAAYPNAAEFGIVAPEGSIGVSTLPPSGNVLTYNPETGQLE